MSEYDFKVEVPDNRPTKTIFIVRSHSYTDAWLTMNRLKAQGYRILSTPELAEWPTFPVDLGRAA